jgi:hypothetical protein
MTADPAFLPARPPWRRIGWPGLVIGGLGVVSALIFLALLAAPRVDGQLIGSDGIGYYVYVRSLVLDGDLDFANEYRHYGVSGPLAGPTVTGHMANKYAIGPSMLWLPFFLAAHLMALLAGALGLGGAADGYGYLYQAAISLGSIMYGTLGFWLAWRSARRFCSQAASLWAVALLWLGSNAFYYMVFEPSMSHMASLFSVALLLWTWLAYFYRADRPRLSQAALLGVAGGLVILVRLQDAPFLAIPYGYGGLRLLGALRRGERAEARRWLGLGLMAGALTLLVFSPQLLAWRSIYGAWVANPYLADHDPAFSWTSPQIGAVLFSTFHGLFSWHPIYLIALAGLLRLRRGDGGLLAGLLAVLACELYIVAAWWAWWQGDAFGGRMFLNGMWIWVLGLAGALEWARARPRGWRLGLGLGMLLVAWNALALIQYRLGFVPMGRPLTWEQMTVERLRLPWTMLQKLLGRGR